MYAQAGDIDTIHNPIPRINIRERKAQEKRNQKTADWAYAQYMPTSFLEENRGLYILALSSMILLHIVSGLFEFRFFNFIIESYALDGLNPWFARGAAVGVVLFWEFMLGSLLTITIRSYFKSDLNKVALGTCLFFLAVGFLVTSYGAKVHGISKIAVPVEEVYEDDMSVRQIEKYNKKIDTHKQELEDIQNMRIKAYLAPVQVKLKDGRWVQKWVRGKRAWKINKKGLARIDTLQAQENRYESRIEGIEKSIEIREEGVRTRNSNANQAFEDEVESVGFRWFWIGNLAQFLLIPCYIFILWFASCVAYEYITSIEPEEDDEGNEDNDSDEDDASDEVMDDEEDEDESFNAPPSHSVPITAENQERAPIGYNQGKERSVVKRPRIDKQNSREAIKAAIDSLREEGHKVTRGAIRERTNLSISTIGKYWRSLL